MTPEMWKYTQRLLLCVAALVCLGLVMIFSIFAAQGVTTSAPGLKAVLVRLAWLAIGLVALYLVSRLDLKWLEEHGLLMLAGALALLVLVLLPGIGTVRHGARRWLGIGALGIQPSEFAKLLMLIFVAAYAKRRASRLATFKEGFVLPGAAIATACGLVFLEPDYGTALLMGAVCLAMLLIAGTRVRYALLAGGVAIPVVLLMLYHSAQRWQRIVAFLDPWTYKSTIAYQEIQSLIALGSGGLFGKGLGAGGQKYFFLPQSSTDFIFSAVGEDLGLLGTASIVVVFILIGWFGMKIARAAKDMFPALLAAGVTLLICVQAAIHIAVVSGSAPTKGITLPFVSMGGSSLVSCMIAVGLLVAVARSVSVARTSPGAALGSQTEGAADRPAAQVKALRRYPVNDLVSVEV